MNVDKLKHTPGPWVIHGNFTEIHPHDDPDGNQVIADVDPDCEMSNREANARLIAAAPDLLEALEAMVTTWEGPRELAAIRFAQNVIAARAAIAKARGE